MRHLRQLYFAASTDSALQVLSQSTESLKLSGLTSPSNDSFLGRSRSSSSPRSSSSILRNLKASTMPNSRMEPRPHPDHSQAQNTDQGGDYEDCLPCRIVGTGALGTVGGYALYMSRARAPGSVVGKRIMGGVGICTSCWQRMLRSVLTMANSVVVGFLVASALRWMK